MPPEQPPIFIGLAGPSGAGKTTLVRAIKDENPHVTHIRLDGFFKPYETFPSYKRWVNRESPENIEWDMLHAALLKLRSGAPTEFPVYEKKSGVQSGTELITPTPIIFVEGYLLYYDPRIRNLFDAKFYLTVSVEQQYARKKNRWPEMDDAYFYDVVVPIFEMHGSHGARFADEILDGDVSEGALLHQLIQTRTYEKFIRPRANLPHASGIR